MNWIQVLTIIVANIGFGTTMFLWLRKEANADRREISSSMIDFRKMWAQESKEFHGRLVAIEERNRK